MKVEAVRRAWVEVRDARKPRIERRVGSLESGCRGQIGSPWQMQAIVFAGAVVTRLQVSSSRHRSCAPKTSEGGK